MSVGINSAGIYIRSLIKGIQYGLCLVDQLESCLLFFEDGVDCADIALYSRTEDTCCPLSELVHMGRVLQVLQSQIPRFHFQVKQSQVVQSFRYLAVILLVHKLHEFLILVQTQLRQFYLSQMSVAPAKLQDNAVLIYRPTQVFFRQGSLQNFYCLLEARQCECVFPKIQVRHAHQIESLGYNGVIFFGFVRHNGVLILEETQRLLRFIIFSKTLRDFDVTLDRSWVMLPVEVFVRKLLLFEEVHGIKRRSDLIGIFSHLSQHLITLRNLCLHAFYILQLIQVVLQHHHIFITLLQLSLHTILPPLNVHSADRHNRMNVLILTDSVLQGLLTTTKLLLKLKNINFDVFLGQIRLYLGCHLINMSENQMEVDFMLEALFLMIYFLQNLICQDLRALDELVLLAIEHLYVVNFNQFHAHVNLSQCEIYIPLMTGRLFNLKLLDVIFEAIFSNLKFINFEGSIRSLFSIVHQFLNFLFDLRDSDSVSNSDIYQAISRSEMFLQFLQTFLRLPIINQSLGFLKSKLLDLFLIHLTVLQLTLVIQNSL